MRLYEVPKVFLIGIMLLYVWHDVDVKSKFV